MVKAYLKYERATSFGVVSSSSAQAVALPSAGRAAFVAAPAIDAVAVWNMRSGTLASLLANSDTRRAGPVTALALAPDSTTLAAGYADGSVRIWAVVTAVRTAASAAAGESGGKAEEAEPEPLVAFNGHRSAISSLSFMLSPDDDAAAGGNSQGSKKRIGRSAAPDANTAAVSAPTRLASGSNDGDVILWDIVGETGLFRLMAHNDAVTALKLLARSPAPILISASKDGLLRVYDVESQHCVQTVVGHHAEVWSMDVDPSHHLLVTGSVDAELRTFLLRPARGPPGDGQASAAASAAAAAATAEVGDTNSTDDGLDVDAVLVDLGAVKRTAAAGRVVDVTIRRVHGQVFASICAADKSAELFKIRSAAEAEQHRKRRRQRRAEKARRAAAAAVGGDASNIEEALEEEDDKLEAAVVAKDYLVSLRSFKTPARARSVIFADSLQGEATQPMARSSRTIDVRVIMQLNNNALELHSIRVAAKRKKPRKKQKRRGSSAAAPADEEEEEEGEEEDEEEEDGIGAIERVSALEAPGHRGDVRSMALSPDDSSLISVSRKSAKLWNLATGKCIRTMTTAGYSLCTRFVGADARFAAVGSKEGALEVFDLGSGELLTAVPEAHGDAIWSMALDDRIYESTTVVTGGADKCVKFWDFSGALSPGGGGLKLLRTLELQDEVLAVAVAHGRDQPVLVVALMDSTVRAFDLATLDPYMSFYGHKMPVLSLDVSSDGLLLATGSADKTIKLWGMDFGDCRRSLRAHDDSVQCVAFQPDTHYLFSGSRDGTLKYWDCDKFEFIASMEGQRGHVWTVAVGEDGEIVATGGRDRLMRVWRRTDEQVFLEEEQDRRMDDMFESALIDDDNKEAHKARSKVVGFMDDPTKGEALTAGKRSLETVKAGEKLLEALQLGEAEQRRVAEGAEDAPSPLLLGLSADLYVLRALEQIRSPELEEALALLPLDQAGATLSYCARLMDESCQQARLATELLSRTVLFLFKLHHSQIVAGAVDRQLVAKLKDVLDAGLRDLRARFGFNASALSFWQLELADRDDAPFRDAAARAFNLHKAQERRQKRVKL
jgi:U3 small nucleolar RNA-associated protein 12